MISNDKNYFSKIFFNIILKTKEKFIRNTFPFSLIISIFAKIFNFLILNKPFNTN